MHGGIRVLGARQGERFGRWAASRHPLTIAAAALVVFSIAGAWMSWGVSNEWGAAGNPALLVGSGAALAMGIQVLWALALIDPHPFARRVRDAVTWGGAGLGVVAASATEPVRRIELDPSLYVLLGGYMLAATAMGIPLMVLLTRARLRHGGDAEQVLRDALRRWFDGAKRTPGA